MRQSQAPLYTIVTIVALLMIGGFVVVFLELSNLRNEVSNLQFATARPAESAPTGEAAAAPPTGEPLPAQAGAPSPASTPPTGGEPPSAPAAAVIPTAIIFEVQSSAALQPQVTLTVAVDEVSRAGDGAVTVRFKAYTNRASGYSALEPRYLFKLIDLSGGSQQPVEVAGTFSSIPAKSVSEGYATFTSDPTRNTLILQVGGDGNPVFYEFNFAKKSYKETQIG